MTNVQTYIHGTLYSNKSPNGFNWAILLSRPPTPFFISSPSNYNGTSFQNTYMVYHCSHTHRLFWKGQNDPARPICSWDELTYFIWSGIFFCVCQLQWERVWRPLPWCGKCRSGYWKTGGTPLPRKRAPLTKKGNGICFILFNCLSYMQSKENPEIIMQKLCNETNETNWHRLPQTKNVQRRNFSSAPEQDKWNLYKLCFQNQLYSRQLRVSRFLM